MRRSYEPSGLSIATGSRTPTISSQRQIATVRSMSARRCCRVVKMFPTLKQTNETLQSESITMKYALLLHLNKEVVDQFKDTNAKAAARAAGMAYGEALRAAGVFVAGAGLEPPETATVVSVRNGKRQVHDGPYAETKEYLGGLVIIDVPNLDAALEWAARHPAAADVFVEVRPLAGLYFAAGGK